MNFTEEEFNLIKENLKTIETIVMNASCSNISIQFREAIVRLAKQHKLISCNSCNTALYLAVTRIYSLYLQDKQEIESQNKNNDNKNGIRKSTKRSTKSQTSE